MLFERASMLLSVSGSLTARIVAFNAFSLFLFLSERELLDIRCIRFAFASYMRPLLSHARKLFVAPPTRSTVLFNSVRVSE